MYLFIFLTKCLFSLNEVDITEKGGKIKIGISHFTYSIQPIGKIYACKHIKSKFGNLYFIKKHWKKAIFCHFR